MTVMMGGQPIAVYRRMFDEITERAVNLEFRASTLAMFVYDDPLGLNGDYMTYKIVPLGDVDGESAYRILFYGSSDGNSLYHN